MLSDNKLLDYPENHFYRNPTFLEHLKPRQQTALNALAADESVKGNGPREVVAAFSGGNNDAAERKLTAWVRAGKQAKVRQGLLIEIANAPNDTRYSGFSFEGIDKDEAKEAVATIEALTISSGSASKKKKGKASDATREPSQASDATQ